MNNRITEIDEKENAYDYSLLFVILFIACFGLVMIYSASYYSAQLDYGNGAYYCSRQFRFLILGTVLMLLVSRLPYRFFASLWGVGWFASFILMVLTNFTPLGISRNGSKRWFGIGGRALFQPSELVKIVVILTMALLVATLYRVIERKRTIQLILTLIMPLDILVVIENLSAGIIIFAIAFAMWFVSCRNNRKFIWLLFAAIAGCYTMVRMAAWLAEMKIIKGYQASRLIVWLHPEQYSQDGGYQVMQGMYAIGSGGLFGKGLGNSVQKLSFLPESQNDMIFSIICEELGIFGAVCVILLFMFLLYRLMVIAANAPDLLGSMIVIGVMVHIAIQVFLNIAVVVNLVPNTGISLPFISYGGSSLVLLMMEMGLALSVSRRIILD